MKYKNVSTSWGSKIKSEAKVENKQTRENKMPPIIWWRGGGGVIFSI